MRIHGLCLATLVLALPVAAHEYWLEPEPFTPEIGVKVRVRLFVGDRFAGDTERAFQKNGLHDFAGSSPA